MEPKEFDEIEFPRGDTYPIMFELTDSEGNPLNTEDLELYFTMKKSYRTTDAILQKRLSRGEITIEGKNVSFILEHKDTARLNYGSYVFDIELKSGDYVKTLGKGTITLTDESTHIANE